MFEVAACLILVLWVATGTLARQVQGLCIAPDRCWPDEDFQHTSPLIILWFVGFLRLLIHGWCCPTSFCLEEVADGWTYHDSVSNVNLCQQDYGKESQAKDVIEEYFKSKK